MSYFNKTFLFAVVALAFITTAQAQTLVKGTVQDETTKDPVASAIAAVIGDSGIVKNVNTDEDGNFSLLVNRAGKYRLRVSFIGYGTINQELAIKAEGDTIDMGVLPMISGLELGMAVVTAQAARVTQVEDTTIYSASAYRVPTGSTLEALVKQFPGIQVSNDGTITWNGKTVSEFLINGKDFFKGDTETAMKNLPADLVSLIKAYDKKSDYAEQTGIDDGNETTVLDVVTKRELNESWITNNDLGIGTHGRYSDRIFISRFTDRSHLTLIGNLNNTNGRGMGSPRGFGGESGQTTRKNAALSYSWENGKKRDETGYFSFTTDMRFDHRINEQISETASETFLTTGANSSFSNRLSRSRNSGGNFNANARVRWQPDSMTMFSFRPRISYSRSKSKSQSQSATFNADPNEVAESPLDSVMRAISDLVGTISPAELAAITVNGSHQQSRGYSHSFTLSGSLNLTRKLSSKGTNLSLELEGSVGRSKSRNYSLSDIEYFNTDRDPNFINRYTYTPSKNWNYSAELGYVQWLGGRWFSELEYEFSHRFSDSERTLYRLDSIPYKFPGEGYDYFLTNDFTLGTLAAQEVMNEVIDQNNSQYARYHYYNHSIQTGVRFSGNPLNLSIGLTFNPQYTTLDYVRPGLIDTRVNRHVFNLAPRLRLRYRFSRTNNLDISYRGSASQPSMTDLIDVWDDSNPLNISGGNPNLKPSWTNRFEATYRGYNTDRQRGISARLTFSQTSNSISSRVVYDESTGVRYTRPDNINGNWNAGGNFMFNTPIDYDRYLSLTTNTNISYRNAVGYISTTDRVSQTRALFGIYYTPRLLNGTAGSGIDYTDIFNNATNLSRKNTTRTLGVDETVNLAYRRSWYDIGLIGRVQYQHARATLNNNGNMDTWDFSYGASANFTFDWGMAISTDIRMNSRRGYSVSTMNTNELVWNAQISQSFLRNRAATISLQFYDILHNQSNISRTLSATMRSDSKTNAINSYMMVHFIYKLNIFGGTSRDNQMRNSQSGQRGGRQDFGGGQDGPPSDGGFGGGGFGGRGGGGGFGGGGGRF